MRIPGLDRSMADPATEAVETTMYRALAVLRVVVLVNALALGVYNWDSVQRPAVAVTVLVGITLWTGVAIWAYDRPARRRPPLLVADLLVATAAVLASPVVKGVDPESTLPGFWVMGVVLAWGIHGHWLGGLAASTVVSLADIAIRTDLDQTNYGNIFLLMIGGPVLGYTSGLLKELAVARDRAEREAASAAERARLARVVHDGVLQVLALVQRRGLELGGEMAQLGRLAGEQEVALRSLVQQGSSGDLGGSGDLSRALGGVASATVTVSTPETPVVLPAAVVEEVVAVVNACLDNVRRHVGRQAPAWVLLEDLGDEVVVTVRDEGAGIPEGRLEEAASQGRLGVRESIRGRVADLGGSSVLVTAPGEGVEWELTLPRSPNSGTGTDTVRTT